MSLPIPLRLDGPPGGGAVLYVPRIQWAGVLEGLTHAGAMPLDDETAEILRVEAGIPRFLVDMNEETIPLEAGLDHAISHTKGCYVGQEIIVRIRDRAHGRVARHLVGLTFEGDVVPAVNQPVLLDGRQVGRLTSAVRSVALGVRSGWRRFIATPPPPARSSPSPTARRPRSPRCRSCRSIGTMTGPAAETLPLPEPDMHQRCHTDAYEDHHDS